jgi:hypothetical protein
MREVMNKVLHNLARLSIFFGKNALAATAGTLFLSATIPANIGMSILSLPTAKSLNLEVDQVDLQIAVISEKSNSENGFKLNAKSQFGGQFKNPDNKDAITYTMKYGGDSVNLGQSDQNIKMCSDGVTGSQNPVTISYSGAGSLAPGFYTDIVTFTLESL